MPSCGPSSIGFRGCDEGDGRCDPSPLGGPSFPPAKPRQQHGRLDVRACRNRSRVWLRWAHASGVRFEVSKKERQLVGQLITLIGEFLHQLQMLVYQNNKFQQKMIQLHQESTICSPFVGRSGVSSRRTVVSSKCDVIPGNEPETSTGIVGIIAVQRSSQIMSTEPKRSSSGRHQAIDYVSTLRQLNGLNLDSGGRVGH